MSRGATPPSAPPARLTDGGASSADERAIAALLRRVPAPTPNDLAVLRVGRRVMAPEARTARPSRLIWVPTLAFLALLFVVAEPLFRAPASTVQVALASGGVFATKVTENWHASQNGEALREADRLRTDVTGAALLRLRGVSAVLLGSGSEVDVDRLTHGTYLRLARGTLTARVSKRPPGEPFVVQTDRYQVKVVGTLFTVEQGPGDHTAVSVREGIVEVSDAQGVVARVVAGSRWSSDADAPSVDRTPDSVRRLLEDGLASPPSASLASEFAIVVADGTKGTNLDGSPSPPPVVVRSLPAPGAPGPLDQAPASVTPKLAAPRSVTLLEPPTNVAPEPAVASVDAAAPAPTLPPPSASAATAVPAPIDDPYTHGLALEASGDFEGAARELRRAADGDPQRGDLALYTLGRLAQRELHDPPRARGAFLRYRQLYPRGALLPEVDFALLQLDADGHDAAGALAEASRFLANHPTSERVDEVHLLRANLWRDAGRCRDAISEYAVVRGAGLLDDALYSTAYCQRKLGDRAAATTTLEAYLRRFPQGAHRAEAERAIESGRDLEN